jgi:chemotaxis protein histidine kinase CheA
MNKKEPAKALELDQLGETYEIIGELSGRADARTFMGKRRADGADPGKRRADGSDVLIVVAQTPPGDEGNALSHLAADANLLASSGHRNLLSIVEGRWLGTDAFATVIQRPGVPSLVELLSRRDEEFGFPRIANILREANGVLEWARSQKVVHRSITPETLFVEPGSDRVFVSFAISPLPSSGVPGSEADGRTIARLARAMLTRSPVFPEREDQPLAELRPGLAASLVEETEAWLQPERASGDLPDINGYIARIAMADALKSGQTHLTEARNAIEIQRQAHRDQLEKERREHEQQLAAERQEHERRVAEQASRFQKESDSYERDLAKERKQLAKEQQALAKERAAHAQDREKLVAERAEHTRDRAALNEERAAHARDRAKLLEERAANERLTAEHREQLAAEAAALEAQAVLYAQTAELPTPAEGMEAIPSEAPIVEERVADVPAAPPKKVVRIPIRSRSSRWNREPWHVPVAAAALGLIVVASALALGRLRNPTSDGAETQAALTTPAPQVTLAPARGGTVVDSAGGAVFSSIVPLPDSATAAAAADSAAAQRARRAARRAALAALARQDSLSRAPFVQGFPPGSAVDTTKPVKPDSGIKQDTTRFVAPPKRDSVPKADTLRKRDTTSFDGVPRRRQ